MKYVFLFIIIIFMSYYGSAQKPFETYFDGGKISEKGQLLNGKLSGEYSSYYKSGTTKVLATYINGSVVQKKEYNSNGNIIKSVYMLNGSNKFQVYNYDEKGLIKSKGFLNNEGLKIDEWVFYNSQNKIDKTLFYNNDILINSQEFKISKEIKDHIKARVDNDLNVGIVVGLINGDDVEYYHYGKTAFKNGIDINENSVFEIGSISKVFTTLLLADKINKGEMHLDDPISKYLPNSVTIPTRNGKVITIKDLATHTSALPRMPSNFTPKDPNNPFADYTYEQLYTFLSNYKLTRDIGVKNEYSNLGMGLLGHILELQSGKKYQQLVVETIAKPLGMQNTALVFSDSMKKHLAKGHVGNIEVSNWDIVTLGGAGGIRSTLSDMIKFIKANTGTLETELYDAMKLGHKPTFKDADNGFEIGLGWHYENDNTIIWHNGQTGGYHSFAGFIKGTQKGVVILTNSSGNISTIGFKLLGAPKSLDTIEIAKTVSSEILESYVGKYELTPNFHITMTVKDGHLFAQATGQSQFEIYASEAHTFFYRVVKATIKFNSNSEGKIEGLTLFQNGQEIPGKKIE